MLEFIYLVDEQFPVMVNLSAALRHLRRETEACILWIDFLCIDQHSNEEKTWHVNMMGDIYTACKQVFI